LEGVRLLVPVGGSRVNILQACKLEGVAEIHLLLTRSLFPNEDTVRQMLDSLMDLGFKTPVSVGFIDGPEAGPVHCRDSIDSMEWEKSKGDYVPDQIFVTGSTLLIVASLSRLFPSAGLIALRGQEVFRLPEEELISTLGPLELDEYLALHGMELTGSQKLKLNGIELEAKPLGDCKMIGTRASLTWFSSRSDSKKPTQMIGSSIRKIVESIGIGSFEFNAFGFGPLMENSSDPKVVNTIPDMRHFRNEGIEKGTKECGVSPIHTNPERALFILGRGLTGELVTDSQIDKREEFDIRATGEITEKGRMTMALIEEEEEE
jgi:hypothetical protein